MLYKVVVMGSCGVGKTAMVTRFLENRFVAEYEPTSPTTEVYHGVAVVDGEPCDLEILDTSGGDEYRQHREHFMTWGDGFLCVYAVDFMKTFVDMSLFYQQLCRVKGTDKVPLVVVSNKIDEAHWLIDSDMGEQAAKSFKAPFVQTSAKTRQGVGQAFHELVREIRRTRIQAALKAAETRQCTIL
ncbi:ras-like protein [Vombatus ursinus]|uniref:ras-like protein n=1 Tax=Vombatus ursinus TaxID=29139 RepID=UPI000FFDA8C4|nr:ras-like protein [Vombatus ursinus]